MKCPIDHQHLRDQIWLKLIGNAAFNPMSLLMRATLAEPGELPEMRLAFRSLLEEVAAVAAALGITLPVTIERRFAAAFAVGNHKTSMLQDFEEGKPLEIDCLTGAVLEIARSLTLLHQARTAIGPAIRPKRPESDPVMAS